MKIQLHTVSHIDHAHDILEVSIALRAVCYLLRPVNANDKTKLLFSWPT